MYGSGPRVATRYASALGRNVPSADGSGLPVSGIVSQILLERRELAALAGRLGKDDALAQDRVALAPSP